MSLTALLIGNQSLTAECGNLWLDRGHRIEAVVTHDLRVADWAKARGLLVLPSTKALQAAHAGLTADWILSVANLSVTPEPVLRLARQGAVNFHDGPLPGYAGLNVPVWALLNGETRHAITWHLMTASVDAGDILATADIEIDGTDTAFTLNARCFDAALKTFPGVISVLEAGGQPRQPQAVGQHRLYRRADRPANAGLIDFDQPAEAVARFVRALDHGGYRNPLAVPKIDSGGQVLAVSSATVVPGSGQPGMVLAVSDAGLTVACATGAVRLAGLTDMAGRAAAASPARLGSLGPADATRLTATMAAVAEAEMALRAQLLALAPVVIGSARIAAPEWQRVPVDLSPLPPERLGALAALAVMRSLGQSDGDLAWSVAGSPAPGFVLPWVPLRIAATGPRGAAEGAAAGAIGLARASAGIAADLPLREPGLAAMIPPSVALTDGDLPVEGSALTLTLNPTAQLWVDTNRLPMDEAVVLAARIGRYGAALASLDAAGDLTSLTILSPDERSRFSGALAATARAHDRSLTVCEAFVQQARRSPDRVAVINGETRTSYAALADRAARIAAVLRGMGVARGTLVGLACNRGADMVAAALGIQMAGGAYVPMDPAYPADRLALYAQDSGCPVIVTQAAVVAALPNGPALLVLDQDARLSAMAPPLLDDGPGPQDLAYVIYTSGSTGRPKGVMVRHCNVTNFFAGMDDCLGTDPGTWLAVTSLSFDISVLELFWTLTRGFTVVVADDASRVRPSGGGSTGRPAKGMEFSLFYWGNDDGIGPKKYELLLEGAKFADANGFTAVWTPERHFHAFGGPYPNPSVTGAAVAAVTRNIAVRAGSCVAPLHHPARIAEEWAVIDNLTNGRTGLAIASGWQPDDFVLRPENTPPANRQAMIDTIDTLRRLWRGDEVSFPRQDGGMHAVVTQPRPVSKELPLWVTTAGNPETWREAGALGANVLTHLLGQSVAEVADKIVLYRAALAGAGHDPARFKVTLMLHTFIAADRDTAREIAREPMKTYLRSAAALIKQYAWAFPAFKKPKGISNPMQIELGSLDPDEMEAILDFAFQRYFDESGLFGTVDDCLARIDALKAIGVDEIACLIDYGISVPQVLTGLRPLATVLQRSNTGVGEVTLDDSLAGLILRHGVSHLQCTPSMARMIAEDDGTGPALAQLRQMLVGGEALPGKLAADLARLTGRALLNMYGPTETTIWSAVEATSGADGVVNIGRAIANTALYVLDEGGAPVPDGAPGELWIAGEGVAAGYLGRPDLTSERFTADPFAGTGRMYRTGDLVRRRPDGKLDFLGRADHQVKLRGHRIELGEIETALEAAPGVQQAVVIAREDSPGDVRLVAYVKPRGQMSEAVVRAYLAERLPEVMLPAHFVLLDSFPMTPNRKIDRNALPAPQPRAVAGATVPLADTVEQTIATVWAKVLGIGQVGRSDNFFALGGHSLLAVQVHRDLRAALAMDRLAITDIFRFPVLSDLAAHLGGGSAANGHGALATAPGADDHGLARAGAMAKRRALREGREQAPG